MRLRRPGEQGAIYLVGVGLSAVLLVMGFLLVQLISEAARVNVNGQTAAVAGSTAQAVQSAEQGDIALAKTIAQQKARLDEDGQDSAFNLLLLTNTNQYFLQAHPQVTGFYFFQADGSFLIGQGVDTGTGQIGIQEQPPVWYGHDNQLRGTLERILQHPASGVTALLSFDPSQKSYGTLHVFVPVLAAGSKVDGAVVEEVRADSLFATYVHQQAKSGTLFVVGNAIIGPDLAADEQRGRLPVFKVDPSLDDAMTGGLRQQVVNYDFQSTHPSFSMDGEDLVGSKQVIANATINGAPLIVLNYAGADTVNDPTRRVFVVIVAVITILIGAVASLIVTLNRRLQRRERESARRIQQTNDELVEANKQLERIATTDSLTGLPNRAVLYDRLNSALLLARRNGTSASLLLLDLDRFKEINDTLGHDFGDQILRSVGERLSSVLRASDTVARLGGDEFAVVLPGCDTANTSGVAAKIAQAMENRFQVEGISLDVDLSIGIATYPDHGDEPAILLRVADVAMYVAKRSHSGSAVYVPADDNHSTRRLVLMSELRMAIEHEQLVLFYQPQVNMITGEVVGLEALVRWPQPDGSMIMPDQFIQVAEHTGLIGPLTDWVLETAVEQLGQWSRTGHRLGVSVNLSVRSLQDHDLPERIVALLERHGVDPGTLTLEITESAVMADAKRAHDVIKRLGECGVRVAIDDFGTGYSSLGYLKRLPVNEIKLDKSFVLGLGTRSDDRDEAIVRSVIAMAHALDRVVVAEGVEHKEALQTLQRLGCIMAQGYFFSRPMPVTNVLQWISQREEQSLTAAI